jgi:hypothetical protein
VASGKKLSMADLATEVAEPVTPMTLAPDTSRRPLQTTPTPDLETESS